MTPFKLSLAMMGTLALFSPLCVRAQDVLPVNPHWRPESCAVCHGEGEIGPIDFEETEALCVRCHSKPSVDVHIHPTGIAPGHLMEQIEERGVPLAAGNLTCLSCHDPLVQCQPGDDWQSSNRFFFRGVLGGDIVSSCFLCHSEEPFQRFNPHSQVTDDGSLRTEQCLFCHANAPDPEGFEPGSPTDLRAPAKRLCNNCHRQEEHPRGVDHLLNVDEAALKNMLRFEISESLPGLTPSQIDRYLARESSQPRLLPLDANGEITCSTCHNPHDSGVIPESNPLSIGADSSPATSHRLRMDPKRLCQACHIM